MTAWISPSDIQAWLGSDVDNTTALILADAVTDAAKSFLERDLALQTVAELLDSNGTDYVLVSHWPIRVLTSIAINAEPPLGLAAFNRPGYQLDPANTRKIRFPGRKVPRGVSNVAVNYTAGYDLTQAVGSATGLPADIHTALKLTAGAIYNAPAADPNLASENTGGVFSGSFHATGVGAIPPGARGYLSRYHKVAP